MTKYIIKHLRMATMVMGITLATSAGAQQDDKHEENSKANDLLCVAIEGADSLKSALAVLRVEKNGQAQGALCYTVSLTNPDLEDCHLVAGRVLTAPGVVKASYVGLVGTGIDNGELTQNDMAVKFEAGAAIGTGSAAQFAVADAAGPLTNNTGVGSAVQSRCKYDPVRAELKVGFLSCPIAVVSAPSAYRIKMGGTKFMSYTRACGGRNEPPC